MTRCSNCGTEIRGGTSYGPLGDVRCARCLDTVNALVLGRGDLATTVGLGAEKDGERIGWLARVRAVLRRR